MNRVEDIVVIGAGVAGSATAAGLCHSGHNVALIYRAAEEGSSFTNQKWNHSGLLYPKKWIAKKACGEFLRASLLSRFVYHTGKPTRFLALRQKTIEDRKRMWNDWGVRKWGLDWRLLDSEEYENPGPLGKTQAVGGFEVPDRILDFPSLIAHLRQEIVRRNGHLIQATVTRLLIERKRVRAVEFLHRGRQRVRDCSICVLAAGPWCLQILARSEIKAPDLILRKCVVLEYKGELVPGITTCLDAWRHDGSYQDVTLVPFKGTTLAAGTGFTRIEDGDDLRPEALEVERLTYQLVQCFPGLGNLKPKIITCIKTEKSPGGKPNVSPQVYGHGFHGIKGLVVAIPGKASFMFELASKVLTNLGIDNVHD
jgi:glycerol-3-phosphate dehydrogenase